MTFGDRKISSLLVDTQKLILFWHSELLLMEKVKLVAPKTINSLLICFIHVYFHQRFLTLCVHWGRGFMNSMKMPTKSYICVRVYTCSLGGRNH